TQGYCHSKAINGLKPLNILDFSSLKTEVREKKPDHIFWGVNLSGGVNRCEKEADLAKKFHLEATQVISDLANELNAKLIFISTDYVFPDRKEPAKEEDNVAPLNIYGELKRGAENIIIKTLDSFIIARTTNVYGWDSKTTTPNFFMQIYRKLVQDELVTIPEVLKGNPTYVEDLTSAILKLIQKEKNGIYHIVGPENMSRLEWAKTIADKLDFDPTLIKGTLDFKNVPQRPLNLELSCEKLLSEISIERKDIRHALDFIKREIEQEKS
ncbi:MAG: sugar nucleotide-binding protein, partial [Halobacteriovoraceae bacterium]|nr:sugar nucleotide-binding protein [Halobacteriovoraceae bacterium]